jgi:hypothetical protein
VARWLFPLLSCACSAGASVGSANDAAPEDATSDGGDLDGGSREAAPADGSLRDGDVCYGPPAGGGSLACKAGMTSCGPLVTASHHTEAMPAFAGGPIEPGTYDLTAMDDFGGPDAGESLPQQMTQTWIIASETVGTTGAALQAYPSADGGLYASAATYYFKPESGKLERLCPNNIIFELRYTSTGAAVVYAVNDVRRYTLTKR